eukprot:SAG31_NODE_1654_length_7621_cov_3.273597_8_plen_123_part_00
MVLPPAYQVAAPFGTNVGGVHAAFFSQVPDAAYDSWLSVGITDGNSDALGSAGIDFDAWTSTDGLTIDNGGVFWMDPGHAPSGTIVVAQVTVVGGFSASLGAQGKSVDDADDWQVGNIAFAV